MTANAPPPASPMQQPTTWDAVAPGYAAEMLRHGEYAEEALAIAQPAANARVLDVGTGPGVLAFAAARRVAHVTAIDFSPGMIEQLRSAAARDGVTNIEARVMDAQSLAFADGAFDAAFSLFAFMFFPDRARAFRELHRVLRPGGRAVIATWGPIERRPLMKIGMDALAEAMPELPPMQKGDLQNVDDCVRELSAAGFRECSARPFSASVHVDTPEHYLQIMVETGAPLALLRKRLGEQAWTGLMARMLAAVRRSIPAAGMDVSAEAMLMSGTR
jgi:ubiquinone/menaquinone biosynthesis C-methylase UbiE